MSTVTNVTSPSREPYNFFVDEPEDEPASAADYRWMDGRNETWAWVKVAKNPYFFRLFRFPTMRMGRRKRDQRFYTHSVQYNHTHMHDNLTNRQHTSTGKLRISFDRKPENKTILNYETLLFLSFSFSISPLRLDNSYYRSVRFPFPTRKYFTEFSWRVRYDLRSSPPIVRQFSVAFFLFTLEFTKNGIKRVRVKTTFISTRTIFLATNYSNIRIVHEKRLKVSKTKKKQ